MQLKLKLVAEKSATTFGDLPDWLQSGHDSHGQSDTEIDKVKKNYRLAMTSLCKSNTCMPRNETAVNCFSLVGIHYTVLNALNVWPMHITGLMFSFETDGHRGHIPVSNH